MMECAGKRGMKGLECYHFTLPYIWSTYLGHPKYPFYIHFMYILLKYKPHVAQLKSYWIPQYSGYT